MNTTTTTQVACGNKVHRARAEEFGLVGVQHHHLSVAEVRACCSLTAGTYSVEEQEAADHHAEQSYDPDAAYERHLEDRGYWEARADEDREAAMGALSYEQARQEAEQAPQPTLDVKVEHDFAGLPDGTYTVVLGTEHRTFKVKTQKTDAKFAPGQRVLSGLVGPDNTSDYVGLGFVSTDARGKHHLRPWKKYRDSGAVTQQAAQALLSDPRSALVAAVCCRCQRTLTTPESIAAGIGPDCANKV